MRLIMETITGRKGYKNFRRVEDLGDFMNKYENKIKKFRIIEDDEPLSDQTKAKPVDAITDKTMCKPTLDDGDIVIINSALKELIDKCVDLSRNILCVYFGETKSSDDYKPLLTASKKIASVISLLKACIKN